MTGLDPEQIKDRNNWTYRLAKLFSVWGFRRRSHSFVEIDDEIISLASRNKVFLFSALHKSLWETTGIMVALHRRKLEVPYVGMGDNLVRGRFFQTLAKRTGVFLIRRARNRRELLISAKELKKSIITFLAYGKNVMVFPEGTRRSIPGKGRYGDFFPTAFDAVLEYQHYLGQWKSNKNEQSEVFIVPVNVDYSKVREDAEMLRSKGSKPLTLNVLDSLKMIKHIGSTYLSFGKPLSVADHAEMTRRQLADLVREKCLDLVKILPVNIVAMAIMASVKNGLIDMGQLKDQVAESMRKLKPLQHRFRGFSMQNSPMEIIEKAGRENYYFRCIESRRIPVYKLYLDYIAHYLDKVGADS